MSEEFEMHPQEIRETGETTETIEAQRLDDATFEPRAYIEQTGDYQQSEVIQTDFTAVVDNTVRGAGDEPSVYGDSPRPFEGPFAQGSSEGDGGEDITPINLPDVKSDGSSKEPGVILEPLPRPSDPQPFPLESGESNTLDYTYEKQSGIQEVKLQAGVQGDDVLFASTDTTAPADSMTGYKWHGEADTPLPQPGGEISMDPNPEVHEADRLEGAGESGDVGAIPIPLPRPADEELAVQEQSTLEDLAAEQLAIRLRQRLELLDSNELAEVDTLFDGQYYRVDTGIPNDVYLVETRSKF